MVTGTTTTLTTTTDFDNVSTHDIDDSLNSIYNATAISHVDSLEDTKTNLQINQKKQPQQQDKKQSLVSIIDTKSTTKNDYENLSQFNNLDENLKISTTEHSKNIEVESVSSPSSAVMSEENNDTSNIIIDIPDNKNITNPDNNNNNNNNNSNNNNDNNNNNNNNENNNDNINNNNNNNCNGNASELSCQSSHRVISSSSHIDDTYSTTNINNNQYETETSIDIEKYPGNSQANSKFCLINNKDDSKGFNSKTSVFLKEKLQTKNIFDAKAVTINKLLFCLCMISITLFAASICYIVIAHLTSSFNVSGLAFFKNEPYFVPVNINNKASSIDNSITIDVLPFGNLSNGEEVKKYVLKNQNDFEVSLLSFGATIQSIRTKDRNGKLVNVVLGLNNIEEYADSMYNKHFGGIIGRTSNRIGNSEFQLDGVTYSLDRNNGANSLHGGNSGFDMRNWKSIVEGDSVKFIFSSPDGEGGYPGDVNVEVTYRIDKQNHTLYIDYKGNTNKSTPIDLTNHAYFNLNGRDSGLQVYNHEVKIFSDNYVVSNSSDLIPTGEIRSVEGLKYDLRNYTKLADRIKENAEWPEEGYDNYFVVNQQSGKKYAASVRNPSNGLVLDVFSDQYGIQFYTSNFLNVTVPSSGEKYGIHGAFCLESHNIPDAVNKTNFPSSIVRPEGEYSQRTIWSFRVEN